MTDSLHQLVQSLSSNQRQLLSTLLAQDRSAVPLGIFSGELSGLQTLCWYMQKKQRYTVREIAHLLNRKESTIYASTPKVFLEPPTDGIQIPISVFSDRKFSILESLVAYLRQQHYQLPAIASLLNRNYNTIKTVWRRYQQKC